jgi:hypothetical protein
MSMPESSELTRTEIDEMDRASADLRAALGKEFPSVPEESLIVHQIVPGEDDALAWKLAGLKPGAAFVVEVSAKTLFGDLPESGAERGTPLKHGLSLIVQPGKNGFSIIPMVGTLGSEWKALEKQDEAVSLSQYFGALRERGHVYDLPKTVRGWARFEKEEQAQMAFEQTMTRKVIRTPEMEEAVSLAIQKITGKDYAATAGIADLMGAVITRNAQSAQKAATTLLSMGSLDERLMVSLDKVYELQKQAIDEFEKRSTWALTGPNISDNALRENRVVETVATGVVAGAAVFSGAYDVFTREPPVVSLAQEPPAIVAQTQNPFESTDNSQVLWGKSEAKSSPSIKNFSVRDLRVAFNLPTQSEKVVPLTPADIQSLQMDGMKGLGEQWVESLPAEVRQNVETIVSQVETQAISMSDAVTEVGKMLGSDPKRLAWFAAEVVGVLTVGSYAVKHRKEVVLATIALTIIGCTGGVGEIPTATPRVEASSRSIYTIEAAISSIENSWSDAIAAEGSSIASVVPAVNSTGELAILEGENGTITLAAVALENEEQLLFMVRFDQKGKGTAYYLYPDAESYEEGKRIVYNAQQIDSQGKITFAGFQIIAEKKGGSWIFSWLEEGESTPTPFAPTADAKNASFVEIVFKANPASSPTVDLTPTASVDDPIADVQQSEPTIATEIPPFSDVIPDTYEEFLAKVASGEIPTFDTQEAFDAHKAELAQTWLLTGEGNDIRPAEVFNKFDSKLGHTVQFNFVNRINFLVRDIAVGPNGAEFVLAEIMTPEGKHQIISLHGTNTFDGDKSLVFPKIYDAIENGQFIHFYVLTRLGTPNFVDPAIIEMLQATPSEVNDALWSLQLPENIDEKIFVLTNAYANAYPDDIAPVFDN